MAKPNYEYLEEERKKIWQRLISVEKSLQDAQKQLIDEFAKKPTDYSEEAKQASRVASGYRNKSEQSKNTILQYLTEAELALANINSSQTTIASLNTQINDLVDSTVIKHNEVQAISQEVNERKTSIEENIDSLEKLFESFDSLDDKLSKLKDILANSEETSTKIETLHKALLGRKKEIDELYYEIFGYTDKENGAEVEGLRDQLETAYENLSTKTNELDHSIEQIKAKATTDFNNFFVDVDDQQKKYYEDWNYRYLGLETKIESLLPNALTAGLSSAYSEKKNIEIAEYKKLNITFIIAIIGLVVVSILPLGVSYYSIAENKPFEKVISDLPRLVLSFLPLYIPVLWVAYSSNRKMNLSKRLSEEYSHKEVLSKTFEGLSNQIQNVSDSKISEELKNKLLYNLLEVSSENPGKLISDYNKADHPLMDALDKSVQLATAVEKLEKLPGFSKLAQKVNHKSKSILADETTKANKGFDMINENGTTPISEN